LIAAPPDGELTATQALVLGSVGVCATIELAGVRMGTDKADHFWAQGYEYERNSRWGGAGREVGHAERARGVRTPHVKRVQLC
jgi:hypothetical protein